MSVFPLGKACATRPRRLARGWRDAAPRRGARKDPLDRALEALMGVAGDADHTVDPACVQRQRERLPSVVGLGVDGVKPQKAPLPVRAGADGGERRGRLRAACAPALDAGRVEPDVGVDNVSQVAFLQVGDRGRQRQSGRVPAGRRPTRPATSISSTSGWRSCGLCP